MRVTKYNWILSTSVVLGLSTAVLSCTTSTSAVCGNRWWCHGPVVLVPAAPCSACTPVARRFLCYVLCWHLQESFPDARRLIEAGEMIPDTLVGDLLLEALLLDEPGLQDDLGFVVDGFPRTATQVGLRGVC